MQRAVRAFLDHLTAERDASPHTVAAYRRDLRALLRRLPKGARPRDVGVEAIRGHLRGLDAEGLSPRSAARALAALRSLFRFLAAEGLVDDDPTEGILPARQARPIPRVLQPDEVDRLLAAPLGTGTDADRTDVGRAIALRDKALLELLYATGARASEVARLLLERATESLATPAEVAPLRVLGKGRKERIVLLGGPCRVALARYLEHARPALEAGHGRDGGRHSRRATGATAAGCSSRGRASRSTGSWSSASSAGPSSRPAWPPTARRPTRCATASPPTWSSAEPTCASSRSCWVTPGSRPPRSTPTWTRRGSSASTRPTTRGGEESDPGGVIRGPRRIGSAPNGGATDMATNQAKAFEKIKGQLAKDKIVIYMKGTKDAPRCGFSAQASTILKMHGKPFESYDVLEDEEIWNHLDELSGWETFPQIFVDGKLVGGCDIVTEMHQSGELKKVIDAAFTGAEKKTTLVAK